jgi:hypothetical protein
MNVYALKIGLTDGSDGEARRSIYVLGSSVEDAAEKGREFLKDDYSACPEELENYAVISITRLMQIDWPLDPQS